MTHSLIIVAQLWIFICTVHNVPVYCLYIHVTVNCWHTSDTPRRTDDDHDHDEARMWTTKGRPRCVPSSTRAIGDDGTSVVTVRCVVCAVPRTRTSAALRALKDAGSSVPDGLGHVKRARGSEDGSRSVLIVGAARESGGEGAEGGDGDDARAEARAAFGEATRALAEAVGGEDACEYTYAYAPVEAPTDKEEWARANAVWPCAIVAKDPRRLAEEEPPSEETVEYMRKWTASACARAFDAKRGECGNCVIIVDPVGDREVAQAMDESDEHPLRHAAVAAVDYAARVDLETFPEEERVQALIDARREEKIAEENASGDDKKRKRDAQVKGSTLTEIMGRPYLCTGYDAFMVREPCIMCAMALVHSRLKRVIFACPNAKTGALTGPSGVRRLHGVKSLNHHYFVYTFDIDENSLLAACREAS